MTQATSAQQLKDNAYRVESQLVGLFWRYPDYYIHNNEERINMKMFLNLNWAFYFRLGRILSGKGLLTFDDITVYRIVDEVGQMSKYEEYGGYNVVQELMEEMEDAKDNFDACYADLQKYNALKNLYKEIGEVSLKDKNNPSYNYQAMDTEQLHMFWMDKINRAFKDVDNRHDSEPLLKGLKDRIRKWSTQPKVGLPFFQSKKMTDICVGWDFGQIYLNGFHSGKGKTSLAVSKLILSCIEHNEKLLVIANEQDIDEFAQTLILTIAGNITKEYVSRQRFLKGNFTEDELAKMDKAAEWVEEHTKDDGLIQFVFLESYTMANVKKNLIHYANRGYKSVIIDTGKPSDNLGGMQRWERFVLDMEELYKMVKSNAGGLNLRMWVNVQLTDESVGVRYLDERSLGDSKKIKNVCSFVGVGRFAWDDEYTGEDNEVICYNWVPNPLDPDNPTEKTFTLDKTYIDKNGKPWPNSYFFYFIPKNRRGKTEEILVFSVNHNTNSWYEVGWAKIPKYSTKRPIRTKKTKSE